MIFEPPVPPASDYSAGVCFGGGTRPEYNSACNPDGCALDGTAYSTSNMANAPHKWYSIGGGGRTAGSQMGDAGLKVYTLDRFKKLAQAGYSGIFSTSRSFLQTPPTPASSSPLHSSRRPV